MSGLSLAGCKCPWGYNRNAESKGTAYVTHVWPEQPGGREQVWLKREQPCGAHRASRGLAGGGQGTERWTVEVRDSILE